MTHISHIKLFFAAIAILLIMDAGVALAAQDNSPAITNSDLYIVFNEKQTLSDEELDEMRGGFFGRDGLIIDFIFSTNTLIDGELINQVVLNSADPALTNMPALRNVIQVGEGNSAFNGNIDVDELPNILSIVQNNLDDITIQQVNLLDLSVKNFDNYVQRAIAPEIDFQNTLRMAP